MRRKDLGMKSVCNYDSSILSLIENTQARTKENHEKIKLNKQLPYLVSNVVEVYFSIINFLTYEGFGCGIRRK